jgi:predicted Zn-ribbon and HTH transcriptional regulator
MPVRMPRFAPAATPRGVVAIGDGRNYIWVMDEKDIIERLGPPDRVVDLKERLRSREWQCSRCGLTVENDKPIPVPAPCPLCGSVAFEAVGRPPN